MMRMKLMIRIIVIIIISIINFISISIAVTMKIYGVLDPTTVADTVCFIATHQAISVNLVR